MTTHGWQAEHAALREILEKRLGDKESCLEMLEVYDELMRTLWTFVSRLLGDGGTEAVLNRSIRLASTEAPLLRGIHVSGRQVDFGQFRELFAADCGTSELNHAFLQLGEAVLQTLSGLTGDVVTAPLLKHLVATGPD